MSLSRTDVLIKQCTPENWDGPDAAGVCRDYKALWGMTLVGSYVLPYPGARYDPRRTN